MCHQCLGRAGALICLESLQMYLFPVTSFRPVAAAIDGISIVCCVYVTVLDGMNFSPVHDETVQLISKLLRYEKTVLNKSNYLR
jgi:hypothetical protein